MIYLYILPFAAIPLPPESQVVRCNLERMWTQQQYWSLCKCFGLWHCVLFQYIKCLTVEKKNNTHTDARTRSHKHARTHTHTHMQAHAREVKNERLLSFGVDWMLNRQLRITHPPKQTNKQKSLILQDCFILRWLCSWPAAAEHHNMQAVKQTERYFSFWGRYDSTDDTTQQTLARYKGARGWINALSIICIVDDRSIHFAMMMIAFI